METTSGTTRRAILMLNISERCNLACRYCIVGGGVAYGSGGRLMDLEVARAAVDWAMSALPSLGHLLVAFYGGEPLLNFPVIAGVVDYATRKARQENIALRFSLTTNGVAMDRAKEEYLARHPFEVIVSLDGPHEVHDRNRLTSQGRGTHARASRALMSLARRRSRSFRVGVSMTLSRGVDSVSVFHYAKTLPVDSLKMEWVRMPAGGEFLPDTEDRWRYREVMRERREWFVASVLAGRPAVDYTLSGAVLRLFLKRRTERHCGAGTSTFGAGADGSLYPCSYYAGHPEYRVGDVTTGLDPGRVSDYLASISVSNIGSCRSCEIREVCGGGCPASRALTGRVDCPLLKAEVEEAQAAYEALMARDPTTLLSLGGTAESGAASEDMPATGEQ